MTDIAALAASLGKPVAQGLLSFEQAEAALAAATARAMREGTLQGNGTLEERFHAYRHVMGLHARNYEAKCELVTGAIKRLLQPMIVQRRPWNELLAEAHEINGSDGFPLTEREVGDVVETEVWFSLPRAPKHGR